jgi:hypothetical protein
VETDTVTQIKVSWRTLRADDFVLDHANVQCFCAYTEFAASIISIYEAQAACFLFLQTSWHTHSFIEPPYEVLCCKTTLTRQYNAWYAAHCLILVACCTHSINKVKKRCCYMTLNSATSASQNEYGSWRQLSLHKKTRLLRTLCRRMLIAEIELGLL